MSEATDRTIAAVIPASDPGGVAETIRSLPAMVDRAYVVDHGTTESEWTAICRTVAEAGQADRGTDRVVAAPRDCDTGTGIETGYLQALEDGVDMTIVLDSDRADPAAIAPHIRPIVEDVDGLRPLVAIDPATPDASEADTAPEERSDDGSTAQRSPPDPASATVATDSPSTESDVADSPAQRSETDGSSERAEPPEIENV